jgi:hypothetical protein
MRHVRLFRCYRFHFVKAIYFVMYCIHVLVLHTELRTEWTVFKCERWNNKSIFKTKYKINKAGNQTYIASPLSGVIHWTFLKTSHSALPFHLNFQFFVHILDTNEHNCKYKAQYLSYSIVYVLTCSRMNFRQVNWTTTRHVPTPHTWHDKMLVVFKIQ